MFSLELIVQRSGLRVRAGVVASACLALAGCAGQQLKVPEVINTTPNPFANEKRAAHCEVSPLQTDAAGRMSVVMTVTTGDGGLCPLSVSKGGGGSFVSFGVVPPPEHGKAFLYNYDGRTYVEYTPVADYRGEDSFSVELIPAHAQPRRQLKVDVHVEAPAEMAGSAEHESGHESEQKPSLLKRTGHEASQLGRQAGRTVRRAAVRAGRAVGKAAKAVGKAIEPSAH